MRLFVLVRHGQSLFNVDGVVNGDLRRDKGLSEQGIVEARRLGQWIAAIEIQVAVISPFPRAVQTTEIALEGRDVPFLVDDDLGDVRIGTLEGRTLAAYRESRPHSDHHQRFPGGESLNEAARRYAAAFARLLRRTEQATLVVCHEIPVRYALNAAQGSNHLDHPVHAIANAAPYLFDDVALQRAVPRMRELSGRRTPREEAAR